MIQGSLLDDTPKSVVFEKILFQKNDFAIFVDSNGDVYKGEVYHDPSDLIGVELKIETEIEYHQRYGMQYRIVNYTPDNDSVRFYLKSIVRTIPSKTIDAIAARYTREELARVIRENPLELLAFKGIGKKRLKRIVERFLKYEQLIELTELLAPYSVSTAMIKRIYDEMMQDDDVAIVEKIKDNPYILLKVDGIGFLKVDAIAEKMGIAKDDPRRIEAAMNYLLEKLIYEKGDTAIQRDVFEEELEQLLGKRYDPSGDGAIATMEFDGTVFYTTPALLSMEHYIFDSFEHPPISWEPLATKDLIEEITIRTEKRYGLTFSDKQIEAIETFTTTVSPYFILAGYAGSGKTTVARTIMDIYAEVYGKHTVVACALSGNAANRIKNVSGYDAYTIHSLLGYSGGNKWTYNEDTPLPYRLVVLDEASMVDTRLFYRLLKAIDPKETKLFIIGDNAQLPPVGAGDPFQDILDNTQVPKVILDKVFRQKETQVINVFAQEIRNGRVPKGYIRKGYEDFVFVDLGIRNYYAQSRVWNQDEKSEKRQEINEKIIDGIKSFVADVASRLNDYIQQESNDGQLDITSYKKVVRRLISSYQVIAPQKNGILGTKNLNTLIKEIVNPAGDGISVAQGRMSVNDKVIHLRNRNQYALSFDHYISMNIPTWSLEELQEFLEESEEDEEIAVVTKKRVFNGQMGWLINIFHNDDDEPIFAVYYPHEDYVTFYTEKDATDGYIDTAYAITIHKSQGSEYEEVAIPISLSNSFMMNAKLLYTALTRAKRKAWLFGESYAFEKGCRNVQETKRSTVCKLLWSQSESTMR